MAVGWVTALKLVPWGDVLEATPQILQSAKKLLAPRAKARRGPLRVRWQTRMMLRRPRLPFSCSNCTSAWRGWNKSNRSPQC